MKITSSIALLLLAAPPAHDLPPDEPLDLAPASTTGQELVLRSSLSLTAELEEVAVGALGLEEPIDGLGMTIEVEVEGVREETVRGAEDGTPTALEAHVVGKTAAVRVEAEEEGRDDLRIAGDFELAPHGRTLRMTRDDEGLVVFEELGEPDEALDEALIQHWRLAPHFAHLLPDGAVAAGEPFELAAPWAGELSMGEVRQVADVVHGWNGMGGPAIATTAAWVLEELELEGTGVVTAVEEGTAIIEYEFVGSYEVSDLVEMLLAADPPGPGGSGPPEGATGSVEGEVALRGTGRFDLAARQLVHLELEGSVSMGLELDLGVRTTASASAEVRYLATLEVE